MDQNILTAIMSYSRDIMAVTSNVVWPVCALSFLAIDIARSCIAALRDASKTGDVIDEWRDYTLR